MGVRRANDSPREGRPLAPAPEVGPLLGDWINHNRSTGEIARLSVTRAGDGLRLRAWGAGDPPVDWGEAELATFAAGLHAREVPAAEAHYDFGFMETHVAANIKYGALVIQTYNRFKDDSGRPNYFVREFFHQWVEPRPEGPPPEAPPWRMLADCPPSTTTAGTVDMGHYEGRWRNIYRHTRGIAEFTIARGAGGYSLRARGVYSAEDWGEISILPCAEGVDSGRGVAFWGVYEFPFARLHLAANENKGLMVIASYMLFHDGSGRSDYFLREFFAKE